MPESPTAPAFRALSSATSSWFTFPVRTISTTGRLCASVTRIPSMNSLRSPSFSSVRVISGRAAVDHDGLQPDLLRSVTSSANASLRPSFTIAAPPYLMTAIWPEKAAMYLSASARSAFLSAGV